MHCGYSLPSFTKGHRPRILTRNLDEVVIVRFADTSTCSSPRVHAWHASHSENLLVRKAIRCNTTGILLKAATTESSTTIQTSSRSRIYGHPLTNKHSSSLQLFQGRSPLLHPQPPFFSYAGDLNSNESTEAGRRSWRSRDLMSLRSLKSGWWSFPCSERIRSIYDCFYRVWKRDVQSKAI